MKEWRRTGKASWDDDTEESVLKQTLIPPTDEELEKMAAEDRLPVINRYEQDLENNGPRKLMSSIKTLEDHKKAAQLQRMIIESDNNPDYDNAELNRRLMDTLIQDPNFSHLAETIEWIKGGIRSREEEAAAAKIAEEEGKQDSREWGSKMRALTIEVFQDLLKDPDAAAAKSELQEVIDKFPAMEDVDNPEFEAILMKAIDKLEHDATFQNKVASQLSDDRIEWAKQDIEATDRKYEEAIRNLEEADDYKGDEMEDDTEGFHAELDDLMIKMKGIMKSLNADPSIEAEIDAILATDAADDEPDATQRAMNAEELADELERLGKSPNDPPEEIKPEDEVPPELEAKVDAIMKDPRLMEKLLYIQNLLEQAEREKADITNIAHEVAPDPYELKSSETVTLKERMRMAHSDPEHSAALQRLKVRLPSPFNVSPAIKSFNQAIQLAYVGANDDVRRVLWRSYSKARTMPTFLINVSDEVWDLLYYSQAVTWKGNQNRTAHLRVLLADMKAVGKDGPPTHPSSLVKHADEQLQDA
ncbi:hypothetical protein ACEQ8H_000245 [Pleosporales sp. CAS-2024a]